MKLHKFLYSARVALNASQMEMARLLKVSQPSISKWEAGESEPSASVFNRVEQLLNERSAYSRSVLHEYRRTHGTK